MLDENRSLLLKSLDTINYQTMRHHQPIGMATPDPTEYNDDQLIK